MRARIFIAAAAWLLGAATATGGCLLAVSLLGDGFGLAGNTSQQLTVAAVNKALADARRNPSPSTSPSATPSRTARARRAARHPNAPRPTTTASPSPAPSPTPTQSVTPAGTVLTSPGGTVVATCESAGAYLLTWSPAQGYGINGVIRGPAAAASVDFESSTQEVTMRIVCQGSTPVSTTSVDTSGGGHDE